jgi:hypothetical protein
MLDHNFSNEELLELRRKHKEKLALEEQEAQELHRRKVETEKKEEADRLTSTIDKLVNSLFVEFNKCFQRFILTDDKKFAIEVDNAHILSELLPGSEKYSNVPFMIHEALVQKINLAYPKLKFLSYIQNAKKHTNFSIVFEPILHNIIPCDIISESVPRWKSIKSLPQSGSVYICYCNVSGYISIDDFEGTDLSSLIKKPDLLPTFWLEKTPRTQSIILAYVNTLGVCFLIANIPISILFGNFFIGLGLSLFEGIVMYALNKIFQTSPPSLKDLSHYLKSDEYQANKEIVSWYDEVPKEFVLDEKTAKRKAEMEYKNMIGEELEKYSVF